MVVLARSRFVFPPLQEKLQERGVEFHLRQPNAGAVLDSEAGKALDLAVRLVINPRNRLITGQLCRLLGVKAGEPAPEEDGLGPLDNIFQSADEFRSMLRLAESYRAALEPLVPGGQ